MFFKKKSKEDKEKLKKINIYQCDQCASFKVFEEQEKNKTCDNKSLGQYSFCEGLLSYISFFEIPLNEVLHSRLKQSLCNSFENLEKIKRDMLTKKRDEIASSVDFKSEISRIKIENKEYFERKYKSEINEAQKIANKYHAYNLQLKEVIKKLLVGSEENLNILKEIERTEGEWK